MSTVLILASASPRRTALLNQIGFSHRQFPVDIDESPLPDETPAAHGGPAGCTKSINRTAAAEQCA